MSGMSSGHSAEADVFVLRFAIETSTGCFFTPAVSKLHWSLDPAEDPLAVFDYAATTRESKRACSPLVFRSSLLDDVALQGEELLADVKKSQ